jgi:hypothetical protein
MRLSKSIEPSGSCTGLTFCFTLFFLVLQVRGNQQLWSSSWHRYIPELQIKKKLHFFNVQCAILPVHLDVKSSPIPAYELNCHTADFTKISGSGHGMHSVTLLRSSGHFHVY